MDAEFEKINKLYNGDYDKIILDYTFIISKYRNSKKKDSVKYKERLAKYNRILELANEELKK
ncbi:hypothetical protein BWK57_14150 [Flavobacterium columnare]|uniref:hypothetical protein n=1 Tax=Flavobacterium columnare TaxID=996 RepID=UPI000CDAD727|nr:hypothetical protein [Flavobacterium columnare]POR17419.1 hypothetical protein BWK57_14150 [Flavobacterium columnare]